MNSYKEYYEKQLKDAQEFQDFVAERLYSIGLPLFNYASKKYQIEYGENKLGVEIKHDIKYENGSQNLYIEIAEKSNPTIDGYSLSGIYRNDNTWLYIIGGYNKIFIFSKKFLKQLHKTDKYKQVENETKTSKGILLPVSIAEKYAAKILTF